jgi:hypothetical protein
MNDLISRSALIDVYKKLCAVEWNQKAAPISWAHAFEEFIDCLEQAPAVDAVAVVRCYKCKQSERMSSPYGTVIHCHRWNMDVDYDGFCHEGY